MHKRLQVLVVEDSEDDAELMIHALRRGGFEFHHERVTTDRVPCATITCQGLMDTRRSQQSHQFNPTPQ